MPITPLPNIVLAGTIQSFPPAVQKTGTIVVTGLNVIGTGTAFLTEIAFPNNQNQIQFKYLFNPATGEIREIVGVYSDTKMVLKTAFAGAVSGDLYVCENFYYHSISIVPLGSGVLMYTVDSPSTAVASNIEISIKDNNGILPIGLNCVSDCQVLTD